MKNQQNWETSRALRVVDANANRAAEGLRTLEDYARLVREDASVAEQLKSLRHRLTVAIGCFDRLQRLQSRSTETDVGTAIHSEPELRREDLAAIVPAACERVSQALRNLEEFSKLLSIPASLALKQLRYEAYDVLAHAELKLLATRKLTATQQLYLLIDCSEAIDDFQRSVTRLAEAGVDLFQLRDKQAEGGRLTRYARAAMAALQTTEAQLIINDRLDIALAVDAAGVHLGQDDLPLADAKRLAGGGLWIGISTHNLQQAQAAEQGGADYIGCGPTFPSTTKNFQAFAGTDFLRQAAEDIHLPSFAIGGITLDNLPQVLASGCRRIAVSAAVLQATDPLKATRDFKSRLLTTGA